MSISFITKTITFNAISLLYCLQDRETMKKEIAVSKEGMTLARSKFEPMEKENTNLRVEIKHLQEVSYQWVSHDSSN